MYRELLGEMARNDLNRKKLASKLGVSPKTLSNKLKGNTEFTWKEVKQIRDIVAPNKTLEELFRHEKESVNN
ncbi:helix-turn-helix domain-containing protein [Clostridioides difficile]|uniref:helix-turn-helix domain-containing protein n=1 Tax=Clostridioides difficile TaxID=1496 RepID=UPI00016C5DC9|nr:helix-turn-helix domain-containing protein [Clostridioides difficile]EQG04992.1 bacterial regulatory, Fis family protein [Clostridioides difficile 6041]EQH68064.1 bacterial regulatory, Fis family protein [Clostridioides difficile DA00305]EQE31584.1 bacterial regulatory, Fis family protein [Clostridioides difficile CD22]EQE43321.1 bacterial regulatory, Fis family protein [Clostridioides difficile CD40]EQE72159.1 bacterial regulatory, Fis family protein [Clostridioides difficile CD47]